MTFETSLKQLNPAQRDAVEYLEGPLLVVAGPGTGKTQLLAMRAANILRSTDTNAEQILCLTFTNKAATNMRERMVSLAGRDAQGITVKTFHGFAAELMNMFPDYFWEGASLTNIPDTVQQEILTSILEKLPLSSPLALRFQGQVTMVNDAQAALNRAKESGLTPDKLRALLQANIAYIELIQPLIMPLLEARVSKQVIETWNHAIQSLPEQRIESTIRPFRSLREVMASSFEEALEHYNSTGKTNGLSEWKKRWYQRVNGVAGMHDELRRNNWWLEIADIYATYRDQLHAQKYYDYADMLVEVISKLEQTPELLSSVQERFLYVMIDEFQDTNEAQMRLAHLVSNHYLQADKPNLMAVGDDDQSIYKFQGADLNNMRGFIHSYQDVKVIILTQNYRSSQAILDTSEQVIQAASSRLVDLEPGLNKHLIAQRTVAASPISHWRYKTQLHQYQGVVESIQAAIAAEPEQTIAVLARKHDSLRQLASALNGQNIPVNYEQQNNIFDNEVVQQTIRICRVVNGITNGNSQLVNQELPRLLAHAMWRLAPETLWRLAVEQTYQSDWLTSISRHQDEHLQAIARWLFWLSAQASSEPVHTIIEHVLGLREDAEYMSPIKRQYVDIRPLDARYVEGLSAIRVLRGMVDEYTRFRSTTLEDFVRFCESSMATGKIIADQTSFASDGHAVQLMTVHKAKGLEFDTVYLIDAVEGHWKPRVGGRKPPANLPLQTYGEDMDDYARLLYVATTRAKNTLRVTSFGEDSKGEEVIATPLISTVIPQENATPRQESPQLLLQTNLTWPTLEQTDERLILASRLENYSLSVTHLLNFLDITRGGPRHFVERNLLRLPSAKSAALAFGTAVHSALKDAQLAVNKDALDVPEVLALFEASLLKEQLPQHEFERYTRHGKDLLTKLFKTPQFNLVKGSVPERALRDISIDEATFNGELDRIDWFGERIIISDYKTGRPVKNLLAKHGDEAIRAWKHRTQLIFYAVLARHAPDFKRHPVEGCQMLYLESDHFQDLTKSYAPSKEEIDRVEQLAVTVWRAIKTYELPSIDQYSQDIKGITAFENDLLG